MDTLHVSRLAARYRLPAGDADARARLDRVLRGVLDDALDQALARAGIAGHEEVCIRRVHAPARLRLDDGDDALAAAWSVALADGIRATLDAGGPGVVRYGSRGHALVDLLLGVAADDLRRVWAWRQLGLWSTGDAPAPARSAEEAARALLSRPESIVAALAEAARAGVLPALAARVVPAAWTALARAALFAAAVPDSAAAALLESPAPRPAEASTASSVDGTRAIPSPDESEISADASAAVARVLRGSRIAAVDIAHVSTETRRALSILAVLEAEPSALRRADAAAVLSAVAAAVEDEIASIDADPARKTESRDAGVRGRDGIDRNGVDRNRASDRAASFENEGDADASARRGPDALRPTRREAMGGPESPDDRGWTAEADGTADSVDRIEATAEARPVNELKDKKDNAEEGVSEEDDRPLPMVRTEAETRWGGLLFLVNLLTALDVADELLEGEAFAARPLRWSLHGLALALLALDARDPAALAFCGLPPERDPPSRGEPPATEEETAALAALADRLAAALHERLEGEPAKDARQAAATLRDVCRRDATVAADPGWIELRLRLDEVRVDVRRAGLDLDPGWVPWLGAVVRFVYE